ncbi:unnamed protein product [Arabidopsis thaliana]|uniref:Uncharacterized protein n=1 Tax=Arabidopsis thaliana TaxID=3702 RepID=A0A5S9WWU0_ARATH|nr:unnamed protein product [Arabidopsis thaliana]
MVPRILHEWLTYIASKVSEKLSFRKAAEEQNLPIAAATTLISPQGRVDFVFMDNEAQEIKKCFADITRTSIFFYYFYFT